MLARQRQLPRAFTLIEMMLVVVVIATLALMLSQFVKRQQLQSAVKASANDMQLLIQAAQMYYVANGAWPTLNQITSSTISQCGRFQMTGTSPCLNNNNYTLVYYNSSTSWSPYPNPTVTTLAVQTTAPTVALAQQLAALLPMSIINGSTVQTTAPRPGSQLQPSLDDQMNNNAMTAIKSIYTDVVGKQYSGNNIYKDGNINNTNNSNSVTLPVCPAGWAPGFEVAIAQDYIGMKQGGSQPANKVRGAYVCKSAYTFPVDYTKYTPAYASYNVKANREANDDNYVMTTLVITYCRSPNAALDTNYMNRYMGFKNVTGGADNCTFGPGGID